MAVFCFFRTFLLYALRHLAAYYLRCARYTGLDFFGQNHQNMGYLPQKDLVLACAVAYDIAMDWAPVYA